MQKVTDNKSKGKMINRKQRIEPENWGTEDRIAYTTEYILMCKHL